MKAIYKLLGITLLFIFISLNTLAQNAPPHPPTDTGTPGGGACPVGGGIDILILSGLIYVFSKRINKKV